MTRTKKEGGMKSKPHKRRDCPCLDCLLWWQVQDSNLDVLLAACKAALEDCENDQWENSPLAKQLREAIEQVEGVA